VQPVETNFFDFHPTIALLRLLAVLECQAALIAVELGKEAIFAAWSRQRPKKLLGNALEVRRP
jgi:hypothetical protein